MGDTGSYRLLILSQVILSLQLPFAVVPLIKFTSSKVKMGPFASPRWVRVLAWSIAGVIISLNVVLVYQEVHAWSEAAGQLGWLVVAGSLPVVACLGGLLAWITFHQTEPAKRVAPSVSSDQVAAEATARPRGFQRIGVALEARVTDGHILSQAVALARIHRAELVLMHVVEGVGGQWYGQQTGDTESHEDRQYLEQLVERLHRDLAGTEVQSIGFVLGYGSVARELVRLAGRERLDLLVIGGHGHRGLADILYGQTIPGVRHGVRIPLFTVRQE